MKPTLFLLAAGMGSRYGGLKQLDGLGPNGETIMDYSIFDAIRGGFGKIVFVIRKDFEQDFRDKVLSKYEGHIPTELVFQAITDLPEGFTCPEERAKPWGTNHAVLMGKEVISEPFAVINADDFYGRDAFAVMGKWLSELPEGSAGKYSMVGFRVCNTLSENGSVARGVCEKNDENMLAGGVERTESMRVDGKISYTEDGESWTELPEDSVASMNCWCFPAEILDEIEKYFAEKVLNLTATLDAKAAYSDAEMVIIAAPTNYDSQKNFFDTSSVENVIGLVMEYNPEAIMVIKSTIPVG